MEHLRVYCRQWLVFFTSMAAGDAARAQCQAEFDERYRDKVADEDWLIVTSEELYGRSFLQLRVPVCIGEFARQAEAERAAGEHKGHPHRIVERGSAEERELQAYGTRRLRPA